MDSKQMWLRDDYRRKEKRKKKKTFQKSIFFHVLDFRGFYYENDMLQHKRSKKSKIVYCHTSFIFYLISFNYIIMLYVYIFSFLNFALFEYFSSTVFHINEKCFNILFYSKEQKNHFYTFQYLYTFYSRTRCPSNSSIIIV